MALFRLLCAAILATTAAAFALDVDLSTAAFEATELKQLLSLDDAALAEAIATSPLAAIAPTFTAEVSGPGNASALNRDTQPMVFAHGMGDSCFNAGMKSITTAAGAHKGVYSVCVPTGSSQIMDTINGFLMNMDKSVDVFANKIKADPKLAGGFDCVGFSQGNSLCRGYIEKYNGVNGYPLVHTFLSVHGTVMGVASLPQCNPSGSILGPVCRVVDELLGALAYNKLVQSLLFQADFLRVPTKVASKGFLANSQLARWNNENNATAESSNKVNFGKVEQFVMVKALKDTMVFPNEGEHWGAYDDGAYNTVLPMKETKFYKSDLFGLKTADEAGKIKFETTEGNHLQFTQVQLFGWLDKYM